MMKLKSLIVISVCWLWAGASLCFAAAPMDQVTVGYSAFSGPYGPLWLAVEEQLGRKYGLDLKQSTPAGCGRSNCSPAARCHL